MHSRKSICLTALCLLVGAGPLSCGFDPSSLLSALLPPRIQTLVESGSSFIAKGTFESKSEFWGGTCLVWVEQSGQEYHLFQGDKITSADFDHVTTPGVSSRLRLQGRSDIVVGCQPDLPIVEVVEVLEATP